ncbi:MAG TPA: cytochrome c [Silvibacterium sp.]|jgi:mono/diheme cytochrome c family protein|nr:cytochrome c [Silvibacterium sp.]
MPSRPFQALCALAVIVVCSGCRKPSSEHGAALFLKNCAGCHVQRPGQKSYVPSLTGYFDRKPRPTQRQARRIIKYGGRYMPPFSKRLSSDEIDDLIAYLNVGGKRAEE